MTTPTNTKERCKYCDKMFELVELPGKKGGYIPEHPMPNAMVVPPYSADDIRVTTAEVFIRCLGGGKRSIEFAERAKANKNVRHHKRVAEIREDVQIAYDAWCEGRTDFDYAEMLELALKEYRLKYDVRGPVSTIRTIRCSGGDWRNFKKDVYCVFCGGLLIARIMVEANPTIDPRVTKHVTGCAMLCLAGRREMMPPDHKGLIDEDKAFYDERGTGESIALLPHERAHRFGKDEG